MKRSRVLFGLMVTLALALSVTMAVPAHASDAGLTKGVTPPTPNAYNLSDTIHYTMSIINWSGNESIVVEAVWDVLPDGSTVYPIGPSLPYTLGPGGTQSYTCDWVATRTGTVTNRFLAHGYQITPRGDDDFSLNTTKQSLVIGREVGGTASLVNKLGLLAPWALLLACAAVVTLLMLRKRRHA